MAMRLHQVARMALQLVEAWSGEYARPNTIKAWVGAPRLKAGLTHSPPKWPTLALHFLLSPEVVGDLEEEYPRFESRYGRRVAYLWYLSQVLRSVPPLVRTALFAWIRRHFC